MIVSCDNSEKSICDSKSRIDKNFFCKDIFILTADVFERVKDPILLRCAIALKEVQECKNKSTIKPDDL